MTVMSMLESINSALAEEMARDSRVLVLGEDVAVNGGVFRATDGLLSQFGKDRVFDTPLSETAIIGSSIGLAMAGFVPVPEIQFLGFTFQAYHQIVGQLSRMRFRSQGRFSCPLTVRAPFGAGVRSPELHSDSVEWLYAHVAGLKVAMPATAADAKGMLTAAIRDPDPVLFLEPIRGYRSIKDDVPDGEHVVPLGQARLAREGDDLVVIAWSYMVTIAVRAAERVAAEDGLSVAVLDLRCVSPLDVDSIVRIVEKTGRVVVVHEASKTGGFAGEVIATIQEEVFYSLEAPIARVTGWDTPLPQGALEDSYIPNEDRVVAAIRATMAAT
jgi:pyruvate dehydrogenase E1 component beta subunit